MYFDVLLTFLWVIVDVTIPWIQINLSFYWIVFKVNLHFNDSFWSMRASHSSLFASLANVCKFSWILAPFLKSSCAYKTVHYDNLIFKMAFYKSVICSLARAHQSTTCNPWWARFHVSRHVSCYMLGVMSERVCAWHICLLKLERNRLNS